MNSNGIYVSLDIGTSNVKVIIGEMIGESLNIIGVGNTKSKGMKKGAIVDIDETVQAIKRAVEEAERMIDMKITSVIVGISAHQIALQPCHGVVAVSNENREISNEDIVRVLNAARVVSIPPEREIIDVIPEQFIVDGLEEINDPRGMIGVRLEMQGYIITGPKTLIHNLLRCVEKAGLDISTICLQPLATSSIALSMDEKNLGVALVDLGGGSTTISVFEHGVLQKTITLPVGGDHVTKDISIGLRTSTDEAENIKLKYGYADYEYASDDEVFNVSVIGSDTKQECTQRDLALIIEARISEIFEMVANELYRNGYNELPGGYVLTGGVVSMPGVLDLAKTVLNANVRVAFPDYIGVRDPQYTASVGLIHFTNEHNQMIGQESAVAVMEEEQEFDVPKKHQVQPKAKTKVKEEKKKSGDNMGSKVKKWWSLFFD